MNLELPNLANAGRNVPCPCGSGRKYKRCCLDDDLRTSGDRVAAAQAAHRAAILDQDEQQCLQFLADDPADIVAMETLAKINIERGDRPGAIEWYRKAVAVMRSRPNDFEPDWADDLNARIAELG